MTQIFERLSYSPESPLFLSRVNHYGADLEKLVDFLKSSVRQMKYFCKDIKQSSKSADAVGVQMKSGLGTSETHAQLLPIIKFVGEFFSEMASSQEILAESLESAFIKPLENFYNTEIAGFEQLKNNYINFRETGDSIVLKYLQSDVANFGRGTNQYQLELKAYDVVQHRKKFETARYDLVKKVNEIEARKFFELAESCVSGMYALRTHHHLCMDRLKSCELLMEELQKKQQQARAMFEKNLVLPIEQKRRDVMNVLDAMVERIEIVSPYIHNDPVAEGSGGGVGGASTLVDGGSISDASEGGADNWDRAGHTGHNSSSSYKGAVNSVHPPLIPPQHPHHSQHHQHHNQNLETASLHSPSPHARGGGGTAIHTSHTSHASNPSSIPGGASSSATSALSRMGASLWGTSASIMGSISRGVVAGINGESSTHRDSFSANASAGDGSGAKSSRRASGSGGGGNNNQFEDNSTSVFMSCEDCEAKMKALDNSELLPFYTLNAEEQPANVIRQGYLWRKNDKGIMLMDSWKRRWFVLDESKLYFIIFDNSQDIVYQIQNVCDTMLASVRECKTFDLPFCFEISYANMGTTVVQAEGPKEYNGWLADLRGAIEKRLISGVGAGGLIGRPLNPNVTSSATHPQKIIALNSSTGVSKRILMKPLIQQIMVNNPCCAECNRPNPEWVSLNIGCMICIECSGVHRSMGVHVSKVRSLTLDDLEELEYKFLLQAGNNMTNTIWEPYLNEYGATYPKLEANDSQAKRDRYIRGKYIQKVFLKPNEAMKSKNVLDSSNAVGLEGRNRCWQKDLMNACESNDIYLAMSAIANGADINLPSKRSSKGNDCICGNTEDLNEIKAEHETTQMPLETSVVFKSVLCCVFLLLNGAEVNIQRSGTSKTIEDIAKSSSCGSELISYIQVKMPVMIIGVSSAVNSVMNDSRNIKSDTSPMDNAPTYLSGAVSINRFRGNTSSSPTHDIYLNMSKLVANALSDAPTEESSTSLFVSNVHDNETYNNVGENNQVDLSITLESTEVNSNSVNASERVRKTGKMTRRKL